MAVLIPTSLDCGRRLIAGVHQYTQAHAGWRLWCEPGGHRESTTLPTGWRPHGIVALASTHAIARHIASVGVPTVNVAPAELSGVELPRVSLDVVASARLGLAHLRERGFVHLGYTGPTVAGPAEPHREAFEHAVRQAGLSCSVYRPQPHDEPRRSWLEQIHDLAGWLEPQPKPLGVLTWSVGRGRQLLEACRLARLAVPDQVAVLAGDDDELLAELADPPLSGVVVPGEQIGFQAAALLARLMRGEPPPAQPSLVAPQLIAARRSTDTLVIDDVSVAEALRFIRTHSHEPIQVADVLEHVPMSRRSLERRFAQALGRSPAEEIRRVRLAHAVRLLLDTELSVPEIAARCGFGTPQYLSRVFVRHHGVSPQRFRRQAKG